MHHAATSTHRRWPRIRVMTVLAVLACAACSGFPGISVDIKALGGAPLGKQLGPIWMNSRSFVEADLKAWLEAHPDSAACLASEDCLRALGFHQCDRAGDGLQCRYHTVMTGTLFKPGDVRVPMRYAFWITLDTRAGAITALRFRRDLR